MIMMGMLNALHRFFIPALSPAMFNVATISVWFCSCRLRGARIMPITVIAIGTFTGGAGQALQWPALSRGFRYAPILTRDENLRRIVRLMPALPTGGRAGESARQQLAGNPARHRRRVVARLRLQADLHADRPVRRPIANAALPGISGFAAVNDDIGVARSVPRAADDADANVPATAGLSRWPCRS
jgi:hypothetical protein